jgi:hypothetical protein
MRRVVTSGPLVRDVGTDDARRDLPVVGHRPEGEHGVEGPEQKESEQS